MVSTNFFVVLPPQKKKFKLWRQKIISLKLLAGKYFYFFVSQVISFFFFFFFEGLLNNLFWNILCQHFLHLLLLWKPLYFLGAKEPLLKGKAQYGWPPYINWFRSAHFYNANIITSVSKQATLMRRSTVLSSVSVYCLNLLVVLFPTSSNHKPVKTFSVTF